MNPILYVIPIVFIIVIVTVVMITSKGKVSAIVSEFEETKKHLSEFDTFIFIKAGNLETINSEISKSTVVVHGIRNPEETEIIITPNFSHGGTHYHSKKTMTVHFNGKRNRIYSLHIEPNKPKVKDTILEVVELNDGALIFKSKFYLVVEDLTGTKEVEHFRRDYLI